MCSFLDKLFLRASKQLLDEQGFLFYGIYIIKEEEITDVEYHAFPTLSSEVRNLRNDGKYW